VLKLVVECERGGDLALTIATDPKDKEVVASYKLESVGLGRCPVR
jgi:hypothetical protein